MKTLEQIKSEYSCRQIWERIFNYVQSTNADINGYGNGFDRYGKNHLNSIIANHPDYANDILNLF